ncbi:MAG: NlpC/P60 family protein [Verrucomicrobiota bacterium]
MMVGLLWGMVGLAPGAGEATGRAAPGRLGVAELEGMDGLEEWRRVLVAAGLEAARELDLDEYHFGSADPAKGGFDCSGAVYYVLKRSGVEPQPPRSSAAQYDWIKERGGMVAVPADVESLDDAVFDELKPGDLLFWAGTYEPTDGRTNGVTHVQIYLGRTKGEGRRVMLGSSDGRSYEGTARCGVGVFDFRLPRAGSKARLVGFGALRAN